MNRDPIKEELEKLGHNIRHVDDYYACSNCGYYFNPERPDYWNGDSRWILCKELIIQDVIE